MLYQEVVAMNSKQIRIISYLLLFVVIIQAGYILFVKMFPDPNSRKYFLKNLSQASHMEIRPTSFELIKMFVSQRHTSQGVLVKSLRERFSGNPDLVEYVEWLEGNLTKGERVAMDQLLELKGFLDQGGELYEYSYEKQSDAEYGLIILKDGKEIYRVPFIQTL